MGQARGMRSSTGKEGAIEINPLLKVRFGGISNTRKCAVVVNAGL